MPRDELAQLRPHRDLHVARLRHDGGHDAPEQARGAGAQPRGRDVVVEQYEGERGGVVAPVDVEVGLRLAGGEGEAGD